MQTRFFDDLQKIYQFSHQQYQKRAHWYRVLDGKDPKRQEQLDQFLADIDLPTDREHRLAALTRLIHLRSDSLVQCLKQQGKDEKQIAEATRQAYRWTAQLHQTDHAALLDYVEKQALLTPYYRSFLHGVHQVGVEFNHWFPCWKAHIIDTVNVSLQQEHGTEVMSFLRQRGLLETTDNGSIEADRSYSALCQEKNRWVSRPYFEVFHEQISAIISALRTFQEQLQAHRDDVFGLHNVHHNYLQALVDALAETDLSRLIKRWAEVDRCWMADTGPLQIGHPLEYYEDHYRKAVAPEWDLRMINPELQGENRRSAIVESMYTQQCEEMSCQDHPAFSASLQNLQRAQLYLGRPLLYYGADLEGLFSAQVVPNDEEVSASHGKKIFAFADMVLESLRSRPFMQINAMVYGDEFEKHYRNHLFCQPEQWFALYDALTIGHEYAHVLWMDSRTETAMNCSGQFKNLEEFKATAGGMIAMWQDPQTDDKLLAQSIRDTIRRSVGLIAWMETNEVQPYYIEGLLHLSGLFHSQVLHYQTGQQGLNISLNPESTTLLRQWYNKTYRRIARHYLDYRDAGEFLNEYVYHNGTHWRPRQATAAHFVEHYWQLYREVGRTVDDRDHPDHWRSLCPTASKTSTGV
ncbi:invasion protein CiaB [Desulfurispira natronophila]|uniref:Ketosteroid isomerase-like protein n=1 Tax=Desulfurispira natronophila TaxID=682562 RepID=A0A7W7Y392_9BACT|nr:invasion protein CiaB [Desulfurispira natronophila]MBB5021296.1 ketosteroid isomerase-like protein [Desulfurispira natronophila]